MSLRSGKWASRRWAVLTDGGPGGVRIGHAWLIALEAVLEEAAGFGSRESSFEERGETLGLGWEAAHTNPNVGFLRPTERMLSTIKTGLFYKNHIIRDA